MLDWTGTRIRADAETILCRDCAAKPGDTCTGKTGKPLQAFPAHANRINDALKKAETEAPIAPVLPLKKPGGAL